MLTRRNFGSLAATASLSTLLHNCGGATQDDAAPATEAEGDVLARSIVFDAHCDTPGRMYADGIRLGESKPYHHVDIGRMKEGGITASFFAVFASAGSNTPLESVKKGLEISSMIVRDVEANPDDLVFATTSDEILQAKRDGKIAILLSLEGGHMIDSSLAVLREFRRLGVRSFGLTHSSHTPWASSAEKPRGPDGLTDFGHEIVRESNAMGIVLDLAHASDDTFFDTIKTTTAPIISSHTCCRAINDQQRNMSDDMLKALAENGGVLDIGYYSGMIVEDYGQPRPDTSDLTERRKKINEKFADDRDKRLTALCEVDEEESKRIGRASFEQLLDHFEHAAKVAGVDHVGFGSDLDAARHLYPAEVDDIAETGNLVSGLRERGFSDDDISKILGGNNLRVLRKAEQVAG